MRWTRHRSVGKAIAAGGTCFVLTAATCFAGDRPTPADTPSALVREALAYEHGEGVPKNLIKAAELYCAAARNFEPEAQYRLGWMYAYGRGVVRNDEAASALFAQAAAAGYDHAAQSQALIGVISRKLPDCMIVPEFQSGTTERPDFARLDLDPYAGPDPFAALPAWKKEIADVVEKLAPGYAIDRRLALAVIAVESNFAADAVSAKGAAGLMQLIPETAVRFKVKSRYDIHDNLRGGLAYLRWLLAYYRGQVPLAAAAYNAGEVAVDKYGGIPPYPETRDYVRRVLRLYGSDQHPYDARIADPSPVVNPAISARR